MEKLPGKGGGDDFVPARAWESEHECVVGSGGGGMKRHIPHCGVEKRFPPLTEKKQSAIAALPSCPFSFTILTVQIPRYIPALDGNFPKILAGEKFPGIPVRHFFSQENKRGTDAGNCGLKEVLQKVFQDLGFAEE